MPDFAITAIWLKRKEIIQKIKFALKKKVSIFISPTSEQRSTFMEAPLRALCSYLLGAGTFLEGAMHHDLPDLPFVHGTELACHCCS